MAIETRKGPITKFLRSMHKKMTGAASIFLNKVNCFWKYRNILSLLGWILIKVKIAYFQNWCSKATSTIFLAILNHKEGAVAILPSLILLYLYLNSIKLFHYSFKNWKHLCKLSVIALKGAQNIFNTTSIKGKQRKCNRKLIRYHIHHTNIKSTDMFVIKHWFTALISFCT